jgi:protein tyrosine phosphatase (PTP) superfamily phosphohydrolase (DUF442 family)
MINRFFRINDNLYRGSAPSVKDVVDLHDRFGIKRIVSLDQGAGEKIDRICKLLGINHLIIPVDATKIEPIAYLLSQDLDEVLIDNGPTFVHCLQGKDRTGMVIAMWDCKHGGASCDEAIDRAKMLGFGQGLPRKITDFYERVIRHYCGCAKKGHDLKKDEMSSDDVGYADIVDNERQWRTEWRDSYLDEADMKSFAPGQDIGIREYPYSNVYNYEYDPSLSTREQPEGNGGKVDLGNVGNAPQVGIYDNNLGQNGVGPVQIGGGFANT